MIVLNEEWRQLLSQYKKDHANRWNQRTHMIGVPMIVVSLLLLPTVIFWKQAVALFVVGWIFQFIGHYFEGNSPSFFGDRRNLAIGVIWWTQKIGLPLFRTTAPS